MSRKTGWQANETGAGINGKVRTKPPSQATAPGPGLLSGPYLAMEGMNIMKTFDELYDEQHETIVQQAEQIARLEAELDQSVGAAMAFQDSDIKQAEQIARLTNALGAITYINPSERCAENKMIEIAKEALEHIDGIGNVIVWKGNSDE